MIVYILFNIIEEEIGEVYLDKQEAMNRASDLNEEVNTLWAIVTKKVHE